MRFALDKMYRIDVDIVFFMLAHTVTADQLRTYLGSNAYMCAPHTSCAD